MTFIRHRHVDSPIGPLLIAASEHGLSALYMERHRHAPDSVEAGWRPLGDADTRQSDILARTALQLNEYFAGTRRVFDLPLDMAGTEFQRSVWSALCTIGFGETVSYGELASRIGNPRAVRAVGLANGRNPVSIVVPCHRVIGADGSMTGYGGGIERKLFLLGLEGAATMRSGESQLALI